MKMGKGKKITSCSVMLLVEVEIWYTRITHLSKKSKGCLSERQPL